MPQMSYFRRPQLAGKSLKRTTNAAVRGNTRRKDADSTSSAPYFPGVAAGQTVTIRTQGGTHTATLTSSNFLQVLADLNSALGANAQAFDSDGCIGIQSKSIGAAGWVEVVGGTAAAAIGFDTTLQRFRALGGEIPSMPEGRFGHQFGSAFPGPGLSFETHYFSNALARVSGNVDIVYSDLLNQTASLQRIGTVAGTGQTSIDIETVSPGTRIYTAGVPVGQTALLSQASTKEELARYFFLVDTVTKRISQCRVTGVTSALGTNILGAEQERVSAANITSIKNGRVVECVGADFNSTGVVAGDFALINGATNTDQWSNNGYRWVVEEVISSTKLALRPMSVSELAHVGTVVNDEQPVLELNGDGTSSQSLGQITVRGGPWAKNARLTVSPAIPPGASLEVWAAVPRDSRSKLPYEDALARGALSNELVSDLDPLPNAVLTSPSIQLSGTTLQVGSFYTRWHGRPIYVPAQNIAVASFSGAESYCVWDEADAAVKVETGRNGFSEQAGNKKHLLAAIPANQVGLRLARRVEASKSRAVTVGAGGQFASLEEAVEYVNQWSAAYSETNASTGSFAHFEIVIVSDLSVSGPAITVPGVTIRGATSTVRLSGTGILLTFSNGSKVTVRDLSLAPNVSATAFNANNCDLVFENVSVISGTAHYLVSGTPRSVVVKNCNLSLAAGLVYSTAACSVYCQGTTLTQSGAGTQQILSGSGQKWGGKSIRFRDCTFTNWTIGTYPLLWDDDASDVFSVVEDCDLSGVTGTGKLVSSSGSARFVNNIVGAASRILGDAVDFSSPDSIVQGCTFYVNPTAGLTSVTAGRVNDNHFTVTSGAAGTLCYVSREAIGNTVFGAITNDFVRATNSGAVFLGNWKSDNGSSPNASQSIFSTLGATLSHDAAKAYLSILAGRSLDIASDEGTIDLGTLNRATNVRGRLAVAQAISGASLSLTGSLSAGGSMTGANLTIPVDGYIQLGAPSGAGVRLDTTGGQGRVVFGKTSSTDLGLTYDIIRRLAGGSGGFGIGAQNADSLHTHTFTDTTGPTDAASISATTGGVRTSSTVQGQLEDLDDALAAKASTSHSHTISNVTGLQTALDGKAATSHNHTMSNITDLGSRLTGIDNAIAGKAPTVHGHSKADVAGLQTDIDWLVNHDQEILNEAIVQAKYWSQITPWGTDNLHVWEFYPYTGSAQVFNSGYDWTYYFQNAQCYFLGGHWGNSGVHEFRIYGYYKAGNSSGETIWEFLVDNALMQDSWTGHWTTSNKWAYGNYTLNQYLANTNGAGYSAEGEAGLYLSFHLALTPGWHSFSFRQKLAASRSTPVYMDVYYSRMDIY